MTLAINRKFVGALIFAVLLTVIASLLFNERKASAEPIIFYQTAAGDPTSPSYLPCGSGDRRVNLVQPFTQNGTGYYCALLPEQHEGFVTYTSGEPGGCDATQPMIPDLGFGRICISGFPQPPLYGVSPETASASGSSSGSAVPLPGRDTIEADCREFSESGCRIIWWLMRFIDTLAALAAVVIVGMIIYAGIQYSMSADDPQKVSDSKNKIRNALIALFMFIFMYAFLQWIVPGGVF